MKGQMYLHLWKTADALAGYFDVLAMWAKQQWASTEVNPMRGRMVRWIITAGDMGQDMRKEVGVVTRMYKDTMIGERGSLLFVEVRLESGASHCMPLRCFFENPDDGALEYRY